MHFDRCSADTKALVQGHGWCFGVTSQDDLATEYTEKHKQAPFDLLQNSGRFDWVVYQDIDEIWEKEAPDKLRSILGRPENHLKVHWVNCWGDLQHIRVDTLFANAPRVKAYNVANGNRWRFDHAITHGCKLLDSQGNTAVNLMVCGKIDLVCLHYGLMTRELREMHKARWDRIYTKAVGNNPYGFWDYCLDEENYPPTVIENPYL